MAEDVAEVEAGHCDLGYYHLEESRECGEHAELLRIKAETSSSTEVSALHDSRGNENLRVLLVDDFQAG